jgi:hypothetical protein
VNVHLVFGLLRRLFPVRAPDPSEPLLTDEERRDFARWGAAALCPFLVFAPLLGLGWYLLLTWCSGGAHRETPETLILLRPICYFWMVPSLFLGILTAPIPVEALYRALLGERYRRFERYCEEKNGFDARKTYALLAALAAPAALAFYLAGVTSFTRFTKDGIEIGRPLSFRSEFRGYSHVLAIERRATFRAPNGRIVHRPHYVIAFDDGESWCTRECLRDPVPEVDDPMAQLVSSRSGRDIVERP